ncbi:unnamed protein product [Prorocentrum cordatum]|uniref:Uncharacterized protein n=1 Tax=Prorocentrum cordatum TaxID=2364126 RepID=A0ABN9PN94_9DINO|nr:unnamed protein product [Polarella glacialis]
MEFMNPSIGVSWGYWPVPGAPLLPDIDSSTSMVIGTSIVGCVVSVLLMLPRNVPSLCDDIAKITDEMSKVWQESMDYLCGLTGSIGHESRHTLATRISWLMSEHASLKESEGVAGVVVHLRVRPQRRGAEAGAGLHQRHGGGHGHLGGCEALPAQPESVDEARELWSRRQAAALRARGVDPQHPQAERGPHHAAAAQPEAL